MASTEGLPWYHTVYGTHILLTSPLILHNHNHTLCGTRQAARASQEDLTALAQLRPCQV